jgi:hypothetical protein
MATTKKPAAKATAPNIPTPVEAVEAETADLGPVRFVWAERPHGLMLCAVLSAGTRGDTELVSIVELADAAGAVTVPGDQIVDATVEVL